MKDNRYIKWILALTFCIVCFAVGFFFGHSGKWHSITISPKVHTEYAPVSESSVDYPSRSLPDTSKEASPGIVNINTADIDELKSLPGIGESLARQIIEYREEFGPFETVDELTKVSGIGKAKLDSLRDWITV